MIRVGIVHGNFHGMIIVAWTVHIVFFYGMIRVETVHIEFYGMIRGGGGLCTLYFLRYD